MKCMQCEGRGWKRNPKWIGGSSAADGIKPSFACRKCRGTGWVITNIHEVLSFLKHLKVKFSNDKEYLREVNQCIDVIEKY